MKINYLFLFLFFLLSHIVSIVSLWFINLFLTFICINNVIVKKNN